MISWGLSKLLIQNFVMNKDIYFHAIFAMPYGTHIQLI
jgi:hypothetical protein